MAKKKRTSSVVSEAEALRNFRKSGNTKGMKASQSLVNAALKAPKIKM